MFKYFNMNDMGHSIRCKLYYNDMQGIQKIVLFGHGFGGHKDNKAAEKFANRVLLKYKTIAIMTFNWPGHGDDVKKKLLLSDCSTYIDLILKYIKGQLGVEDIYVYATSFGGYLFLKYISEKGNPFCKMAFRCPAVNMYDVVIHNIISSDEFEKLKKGKEVLVGFDRKIKINQQFLSDLKNADITAYDYVDYADDILIMHGTKDEIVPMESVCEFADRNVIEFIPIKNADHRFQDPKKMDAAIQCILDFFKEEI